VIARSNQPINQYFLKAGNMANKTKTENMAFLSNVAFLHILCFNPKLPKPCKFEGQNIEYAKKPH